MAALAALGVVAGLLGPVIDVAKLIAAPVRRQFNYLCCFSSNIKTLEEEAKSLDDVTSDLQGKIDPAINNAQIILSTVDTWLKESVKAKTETKEILDEAPDVGSGCSKLGKRYSLSKKAKKATIAIKELVGKCNFTEISHPPPAAASAPVQSGTRTIDFDSRKQIETKIMESLKDEKNTKRIGICGMGGLGKTTMARKIMNRALKEGFDEVVMAVVSQSVNEHNIQLQIAGQLGLKFENDVVDARAHLLGKRLKGGKRILLVLDDVWNVLDMGKLGILCDAKCRVILTSRDNGVLSRISVEEVFQLTILDEKEAWDLFRGNAGECVDGAELNPTAKDVMRECKGLPLALATVGLALKDANKVPIWKDALGQLRRSNPSYIPSIIEVVYNPLKFSYDRLDDENKSDDENQSTKSLFLLCCLFPEDHDIPLEHLAYFAMGLHLFKDIQELNEVRDRTISLIETIKTRGLLLDSSGEAHVRMHDIVRDVSIYIASKEKRVRCEDCTWISSHVDGGARLNNVPPPQPYPHLKLLLIDEEVEEEMDISDDSVGRSTELNVLFIKKVVLLKSLPKLCTSVVTLILRNCASLGSIAAVGYLKCLEILVFHYCDLIYELPEQVRGLERLKLLDILRCGNLRRVAGGVISSMVSLEELKIVESFNNWKGGEPVEEGTEASLREIESLKKLRCLDIHVYDMALAAQPLSLSSKPERFTVLFGTGAHADSFPYRGYQRRMSLHFDGGNDIEWGGLQAANIFLTNTECLYARGSYSQYFELDLATEQSIRWLTLERFINGKNITSAAAGFPLLEFLDLTYLKNLDEIWDDDAPLPSNSFKNLKVLRLVNLYSLKRMGKCVLSTAKNFFLQIETIDIENCGEMEHLLELELVPDKEEQDKEDDIKLVFGNLKSLWLYELPKLTSICSRGIESIQFTELAALSIEGDCGKLKWLVSRDDDYDDHRDQNDDSSHLFCHPEVSFPKLERLILNSNKECKNVWCNKVPMGFFKGLVVLTIKKYKIRSLFSSSEIPRNLVNLQELVLWNCGEMVTVMEDEEEVSSSLSPRDGHTTIFPNLQEISLTFLPKLESFCKWKCALKFPSLKKIWIVFCGEMKSFNTVAGSSVITPALQIVRIDGKILEFADDLNATLQQHFEKLKETRN